MAQCLPKQGMLSRTSGLVAIACRANGCSLGSVLTMGAFPMSFLPMTLQLDWSWFSLQTARLVPKPAPRGHHVVPARIPPALSRRSTQQHGPRSAEAAAPSAPQCRWISSANIARCRELMFRWTVCSSSTQRKCGLCCYTARANSVELLKQKKANPSFTAM